MFFIRVFSVLLKILAYKICQNCASNRCVYNPHPMERKKMLGSLTSVGQAVNVGQQLGLGNTRIPHQTDVDVPCTETSQHLHESTWGLIKISTCWNENQQWVRCTSCYFCLASCKHKNNRNAAQRERERVWMCVYVWYFLNPQSSSMDCMIFNIIMHTASFCMCTHAGAGMLSVLLLCKPSHAMSWKKGEKKTALQNHSQGADIRWLAAWDGKACGRVKIKNC